MNITKKQKKCENGETLTQSIFWLTIRQGVKTGQQRPKNCDCPCSRGHNDIKFSFNFTA